jgi:hypothetical protein
MAAEWIQVSLRGWASGRSVAGDFFGLLGLEASDGFRTEAGAEPGRSSLVYFVDEEMAAHSSEVEPSDSFAKAVDAALLRAARWLGSRPPEALESCRARGINLDVFVGSWIDQDQFDLDLPFQFLLECGRAGLGITIVTND